MKPLTLKLIRKILYKLDKVFDMPKYRVKHDNVMVHVSENHIHISLKNDTYITYIPMTYETYFAIKDKIKSFKKKNESIQTSPTEDSSQIR